LAVIEYKTETKTLSNHFLNYMDMYSVGQKYIAPYSIEYPKMFELLKKQNDYKHQLTKQLASMLAALQVLIFCNTISTAASRTR
jgi:hypothetical protein